jgi:hypothetical protein
METLIADYLSKLEFGELQSFKNMGVIPLLTSINGSPKYLTLKEALEKKLLNVKGVMDAILADKQKSKISSSGKTRAFIEKARRSKEKKYKSVGQGTDHRFEGKAILGSALLYRKKVIHMAFFKDAESSKTGRMSSYTRRRDFRI